MRSTDHIDASLAQNVFICSASAQEDVEAFDYSPFLSRTLPGGSTVTLTWGAEGTRSGRPDSLGGHFSAEHPGSFGKYDRGNFSAQMNNGSSITCNMYVNGELIETNTSTGAYAIVSCG